MGVHSVPEIISQISAWMLSQSRRILSAKEKFSAVSAIQNFGVGLMLSSRSLKMAEREGFYYRHFQQVVMIPTDSENTQCLRRVQGFSELPPISLIDPSIGF
jgi:hypothetical protein